MQPARHPSIISPPPLPRIGQADYMPLLIEALRTVHPKELFDAHILAGLLFSIIAGEKNLIVDVEIDDVEVDSDFMREHHGCVERLRTQERDGVFGDDVPRSSMTGLPDASALLETRVQRTVESVSRLSMLIINPSPS